jgi:isopentenyl diphosphate isomerase/L-lactate dehydrogenase-like FMN-dependent dehydrogenase
LPAIADRINGRAEIFVDSGFQRGSDVVKALALGANGVFVGRAPLWGAAVSGSEGAQAALNIFRDEIDRVMGLLGCNTLKDIATDLVSGSFGQTVDVRIADNKSHRPGAEERGATDLIPISSQMP